MGISIFLAKILGPCFVIIGVGILLNREFYQKVKEDFCKNAALLFYGGILALIIGLIIVLSHNVWVAKWPVIITIYGWGGIIKGTWLTVFPNSVFKFMEAYNKNKNLLLVHSLVIIVLGAALSILGYL